VPPYSPELNPAELLWLWFREHHGQALLPSEFPEGPFFRHQGPRFGIAPAVLVGCGTLRGDDAPESRFAALTPAEVRAYERDVLRQVANLALIPPVLNPAPLLDYDYDKLDYGMTIGARTPTPSSPSGQRRTAVRFPNPDWHEHMIVERRDGSLRMLIIRPLARRGTHLARAATPTTIPQPGLQGLAVPL
jgi:hypothetical protein